MRTGNSKRLLAMLLAVMMICEAVPLGALAAENSGADEAVCVCETACTEESRNLSCPVCGVRGGGRS